MSTTYTICIYSMNNEENLINFTIKNSKTKVVEGGRKEKWKMSNLNTYDKETTKRHKFERFPFMNFELNYLEQVFPFLVRLKKKV